DLVAHRPALAVEVEPQGTLQVQTVLIGIRESAAALGETQLRVGFQSKGRIALPLLGHLRLRWIDTGDTLDGRDSKPVICGEAPYLLMSDAALRGYAKDGGRLDLARPESELKTAGAHLHAQYTVATQASR